MKTFGLIWIVLGALLFTPAGAFAKDKHKHHHEDRHHHHHHHHDWSYRGYDRDDDRDYWEHQAEMDADRRANGYYVPRYRYYRPY